MLRALRQRLALACLVACVSPVSTFGQHAFPDSGRVFLSRAQTELQSGTEGSAKRAVAYLHRARSYFIRSGRMSDATHTLLIIATVYRDLGNFDASLNAYRAVITESGVTEDLRNELAARNFVLPALVSAQQLDSAIYYFEREAEIELTLGDTANAAISLLSAGSIAWELDETGLALGSYRAVLRLDKSLPDSVIGDVLERISRSYSALEQHDSALTYRQQARAVFQRAGDHFKASRQLSALSDIYISLHQPALAVLAARDELALVSGLADTIRAVALSDLGWAFLQVGRPDSALVYYPAALAIVRTVEDEEGMGRIYNNMGEAFYALSRSQEASIYFDSAHSIWIKRRDRENAAVTLRNIAQVFADVGNAEISLAYLESALHLQIENRQPYAILDALVGQAEIYNRLGRPDTALALISRPLPGLASMDLTASEKLQSGMASLQEQLGITYLALRDYERAIAPLDSALFLFRHVQLRKDEARVLRSLGATYRMLGNANLAYAYLDSALILQREIGDLLGQTATELEIGEVLATSREYADSAFSAASTALVHARVLRAAHLEAAGLHLIGTLYYRFPSASAAQSHRAVAYLDSASAVFSTLRRRAGVDENQVSYSDIWHNLYPTWVLAVLRHAEAEGVGDGAVAALAAAERGRARTTLDLMQNVGVEEVRPGATLRTLATEGERLLRSVTDYGATLISYLATDTVLLIWVATGPGSARLVQVQKTAAEISNLIITTRGLLAKVEDLERCIEEGGTATGEEVRRALQTLADVLLPAAVRHLLPESGEIVLAPQGMLQFVPFAALPVNEANTPLGIVYALRYTPSLAVLAVAQSRDSVPRGAGAAWRRSLVIGNPTMPRVGCGSVVSLPPRLAGAGTFSNRLAQRLGAEYLTDGSATEVAAQSAFGAAPLLHFATHGYAFQSEARAGESWIALAPNGADNGLLTVREILGGQPITAELVVLAACATGLGDSKEGEGTVGLQRAFMVKGTRSVLVSLWMVEEAPTVRLLEVFYREWLDGADHPTKAEALRRAQQALRTDAEHPKWSHPSYWAAFQLVGAQ